MHLEITPNLYLNSLSERKFCTSGKIRKFQVGHIQSRSPIVRLQQKIEISLLTNYTSNYNTCLINIIIYLLKKITSLTEDWLTVFKKNNQTSWYIWSCCTCSLLEKDKFCGNNKFREQKINSVICSSWSKIIGGAIMRLQSAGVEGGHGRGSVLFLILRCKSAYLHIDRFLISSPLNVDGRVLILIRPN